MGKSKVVICPYCGESQPAEDWCRACGGFFDELSRQATHNDMGPWFIRNPQRPFQPGCSYETIIKLIDRGTITKMTIMRGPTSKQFWTIAKRVPGIAHLLGYCHSCDARVESDAHGCPGCGVPFGAFLDRTHLGLPEVRPLPWEAGHGAADSEDLDHPPPDWSSEQPRGVSSFVGNSDMTNGAHERAAILERPAESRIAYESTAAPSAVAVGVTDTPAPAPASTATSPALRSMRRELVRQRRMITFLVAFLVLSFVVLVLTNLDKLSPSARPAPSNVDTAASEDAASPAGTRTPSQANPAPANNGDLKRAQSLLEQSEKPERTMSDRLADGEQALLLLESAPATATRDELLDRARRNMEELRLRELASPDGAGETGDSADQGDPGEPEEPGGADDRSN